MLTQTAPRIKLVIDNEDWKDRLKWLNEVSWDVLRARNSAVRALVEKMHRESRQDLPDSTTHPQFYNKQGKLTAYHYIYQTRPVKYLTGAASLTILSEAEGAVIDDFNNWYIEILTGQRKIPHYKDQSIPIRSLSRGSILQYIGNEYILQGASLSFNGEPTRFKFVNTHKSNSINTILNNIQLGHYKFCDSKIIKDGKSWYLHLSYSFEPQQVQTLDSSVIVGVDLGWSVPAYAGLNNGYDRQAFGDSKQLLRFKTGIKERRIKLQKNLNMLGEGGKGHGYKRKAQVLEKLKDKERNFVKTFNHVISKQVIDFALKNNAGTIHLEQLTKEIKTNAFFSAYWSYYQLQQDITYKAKNVGIDVKYVYPHYTSQMCSKCGYTHENNRLSQSVFKCIKCGYDSNADYNASVNIARSQEFCKTKEESAEGKSKYFKSNGFVFRVDQKNDKFIFTEITGQTLNVQIQKINVDKNIDNKYIQDHIDKSFNRND